MTSYAALLGHQPRLTLAELSAAVPGFTPVRTVRNQAIVFESSAELGRKELELWGGTMLLAKKIATGDIDLNDIPQILHNEVADTRGKVTFGLRGIGVPPIRLKTLYRECKARLVKAGRAARYVGNEKVPAATALLRDEGMLDGKHGAEIVILQEEDFLWIGRTVAAQDPDAYTLRDMKKPVRDTRAGLLPPKLAQIMLNFGKWAAEKTTGKPAKTLIILDPFCGTGVIPLECLHRKWPVLASDLSLKAVNGTEKNLEWIRKQEDIKKRDVTSEVWKHDARKPFDLKELPDAVVTETHLGPALATRPTAKDTAKIRVEADALELAFLKNAAASLPGVPLVLMFPTWHLKTGVVRLERVWKEIVKLGYTPTLPPGSEPDDPAHPSIVYRRPDQVVGREIVILVPPKSRA